jgi:hypothetical protein
MTHLHKHYGYVSFGENFFEIRHNANNFKDDIEYVKMVRDIILKNFTSFRIATAQCFHVYYRYFYPTCLKKFLIIKVAWVMMNGLIYLLNY